MPDPHKDLAGIIEPGAPPPVAAPADYTLPLALAFVAVLVLLALRWFWRRGATLRALRRLARSPDVQAGAAGLARLMVGREVPEPWRRELDRLRFAAPTPDAAAMLARLCRVAEGFAQSRSGKR